MNESLISGAALDALRNNLRAAGIPFTDDDIAGIEEKGFLRRLAAVDALGSRVSAAAIPDYLADWGHNDSGDPVAVAPPPFPPPPTAPPPPPDPGDAGDGDIRRYASIADTAGLVRNGSVSPVELTEQALARIAERDPELNAFQLVLAEQALADARTAEREIAVGAYRGPLHGIPVAVKDLLALRGTITTAGSRILADHRTDFDAAAVERLRAAGAVIVGKTRMSEFAYSPGSNNAHYDATANPWNTDHDTGGSSSGSAAAVADGLVFAALGSDTGGSIRIPAALCGIVGLKPTFGRISLHGAVTLSWSLDHLGPLTRSVADAALLLEALSGYDPRDARTRPAPLDLANPDARATGLRVGVVQDDGFNPTPATDEALDAWRVGLEALARAGAELVPITLKELDDLRLVAMVVLALEASTFHQPWLQTRLDDYGAFMRQRVLSAYVYGPQTMVRVQQARTMLRQRVAAICADVDVISTPSQPDVAPLKGVPASTHYTNPFNALGWPAISVPVGLNDAGLPLGIQLAAKPWQEATLLRAARAVEAELQRG